MYKYIIAANQNKHSHSEEPIRTHSILQCKRHKARENDRDQKMWRASVPIFGTATKSLKPNNILWVLPEAYVYC